MCLLVRARAAKMNIDGLGGVHDCCNIKSRARVIKDLHVIFKGLMEVIEDDLTFVIARGVDDNARFSIRRTAEHSIEHSVSTIVTVNRWVFRSFRTS